MKPELIYEKGLLFHHYANTAYPLTPSSFKEYRLKENDIQSFLKEDYSKVDKLSLYVHVPFCKTRCKFCEYVVLEDSTEDIQTKYVDLLIKEMEMYSKILSGKKIIGYDLGGGTPSYISNENLTRITKTITTLFDFDEDTIFSVETTPIIAANDIDKIKHLYDLGYKRISMGVQTISEKLLNSLGREGATHIYEKAAKNIREVGYKKFNIDLMYGFLHQNDEDFETTLRYAIDLKPDYITLYRNRYKGTKIESEAGGVSLYKAMRQYKLAYNILNEAGYIGNPGKNTFSREEGNYGTSDYLTNRVINGVPYVGMGLGAQSFGHDYLAYNSGAATKQMKQYEEKILAGEFPIQDIYELPLSEAISKMVSVAFYFGFVDLLAFKTRFGVEFLDIFEEEVKFVIKNKLMEIKENRIYLTDRGADYINGIIPLFYSDRSKQELIDLSSKKVNREEDEKLFLNVYDEDSYKKPGVATDCVIFRETNNTKEVLLIKRGEHPYMNCYALPGGFTKIDETVKEAALRELKEETNISGIDLSLVNVFSKPGRDPRGWVISIAFTGTMKDNQEIMCGSDSIDAIWVDINNLNNYELAFDHADIIELAIKKDRK